MYFIYTFGKGHRNVPCFYEGCFRHSKHWIETKDIPIVPFCKRHKEEATGGRNYVDIEQYRKEHPLEIV